MFYTENDSRYKERLKEWDEIEQYVLLYQKQFDDDATEEDILIANNASKLLLEKFQPLFRKYIFVLTNNIIDWNDKETRSFVTTFISDKDLQSALKRNRPKADKRSDIYSQFNFIKESYGKKSEDEILEDLQLLLLVLAKRYRQMGRNFCSYVYNTFKFEVARFIKAYVKEPLNIHYKHIEFEDFNMGEIDEEYAHSQEDTYYEDLTGLPNEEWLMGDCSEEFADLSYLDRKILIMYYLQDWKDQQIAEYLGMHINTINQRRRNAAKYIANKLGYEPSAIKRTRRSGKKAVLPTSTI